MKMIVLLSVFFLSSLAYAKVDSLIPADERQAIIMIQGQDEDALNLYNSMNVPVEVSDTNWIKQYQYISSFTGNVIFNLRCLKSKRVAGLASCTLKVFNELIYQTGPTISKELKLVMVGVIDEYDAKKIATNFNIDSNQEIYRSKDNELKISVTKNQRGSVSFFGLSYKGR